jgi:hypothetical protein
MPHLLVLVSIMGLSLACSPTRSHEPRPTSTPAETGDVVLTLQPDGARFDSSLDGDLTGVIENQGDEPAEIDLCVLGSPILSLVFHDASGQRMPTIPPGMPPSPEEQAKCLVTLAPGDSKTVSYGLHIFSPMLPEGTYTARASEIPSNVVSFTIAGP